MRFLEGMSPTFSLSICGSFKATVHKTGVSMASGCPFSHRPFAIRLKKKLAWSSAGCLQGTWKVATGIYRIWGSAAFLHIFTTVRQDTGWDLCILRVLATIFALLSVIRVLRSDLIDRGAYVDLKATRLTLKALWRLQWLSIAFFTVILFTVVVESQRENGPRVQVVELPGWAITRNVVLCWYFRARFYVPHKCL